MSDLEFWEAEVAEVATEAILAEALGHDRFDSLTVPCGLCPEPITLDQERVGMLNGHEMFHASCFYEKEMKALGRTGAKWVEGAQEYINSANARREEHYR